MIANEQGMANRREARGISIIIVAVAMVFILGMGGLAVDLASLYVGRSQSQRAADAAALAGAQALVNGLCVTGASTNITADCVAQAQQQAMLVGNQNLIAGVSPGIKLSDVNVDASNPNDPQVTVVAGRGTYDGVDHSNAMPTFFLKIFGVQTASVSAQATAEAYSGGSAPIGVQCVKPWFIPNCDAYNSTTTPQSLTDCAASTMGPYKGTQPGPFVSGTMASDNLAVVRPDAFPAGAIGEPVTLKPGSPGSVAAPGQYYAAFIPNTATAPTMCPACSKTSLVNGGSGSAAVYRQDIECCNQNAIVCGSDTVFIQSSAGNMVGPTNQGVQCLIQQDPGCGQDYLDGVTSPCTDTSDPPKSGDLPNYPFKIIPGANNILNQGAPSIPMSASNSVVAIPIYTGVLQSGQNDVTVIGFMKMFIKYVDSGQQGTVYGYVVDITKCGGGGSGSGSGSYISGGAGSTVPVRLIRPGSS